MKNHIKAFLDQLPDEYNEYITGIADLLAERDELLQEVEKLKKFIADNEVILKSANQDIKKMVKYTEGLQKVINLAIGFCVDFRQTNDWKNHPEVGLLYLLLKDAIER